MDEHSKLTGEGKVKVTSGAVSAKSFMTAGPTLHYSHTNVLWFWFLAVMGYIAACVFWYAITIGGPISVNLLEMVDTSLFDLGQYVATPISIYEYPWQIVVLGILMGILAVAPVLVSQLLSFRYSVAMILAVMFLAKLYLFGVFLLVSCVAVACRPLRFRSRFIALALCMAPQLVYWAVWGGDSTATPVRWGFSFAPWIYAWLSGLVMAALVLGIGHFTRYKPGLNGLVCVIFLGVSFAVFQHEIGFAELDYYRYIAGSDPEDAVEFQDQSISSVLDNIFSDNTLRSRLEGQFFEFNGNVELRCRLKEHIQDMLNYNNRWPEWFRQKTPDRLKYKIKRQALMSQYENFMERWPSNQERMPTVMYFRAILSEIRPDVRGIVDSEILRFYSDYPFEDNYLSWEELFSSFPDSPEAIEARWRIAMHHARKGRFEKADQYCQMALVEIGKIQAKLPVSGPEESDSIFAAFQQPVPTVMTRFKLRDLQTRLRKLQSVIGQENQGEDEESKKRLAEFLTLNPYDEHTYAVRLDGLLEKMSDEDGLRDNILLEKALLVDDVLRRLQLLEALRTQYPERDGGIQAWYELGMANLKRSKDPDTSEEEKNERRSESYRILSAFVEKHPDSPFAEPAKETLQTLPAQ